MSNISTTATRTPYAVTNSTTGASSSTPINTASNTTPVATASTTPNVSTTPPQGANVANTQNTGTVSASTTSAYGSSASNSSSKPVSSTTVPSSSEMSNMVANTIERNGGQITIYTEGDANTTPTSSSTTPNMVANTIERNGGYITIYTEGSASTTPMSASTTPLNTSSTTPSIVEQESDKIELSYEEMIENIDNQIRLLANDSTYKHNDPEGAKTKLQELQELRLGLSQKMSVLVTNKISISSTENCKEFSFSKEEEKAFDLMVQENIMNFISTEEYSWKQWTEYSIDEKKVLLSNLAEYVSEQLGIKTPELVYFIPEKSGMNMGQYEYDIHTVNINLDCLNKGLNNGIVKTLIHELRHAYQNAVIDNPNLFIVSDETRSAWENNLTTDNYISGGKEGYREQAVEWDAINFAGQRNYINEVNKDLVVYEGSWTK